MIMSVLLRYCQLKPCFTRLRNSVTCDFVREAAILASSFADKITASPQRIAYNGLIISFHNVLE